MSFHLKSILQILLYIIVVIIIAAGVMFVLSYSSIELISRESKTLTPENYKDTVKSLKVNDIIEVTGTLNFLNLVQDNKSDYVYAGLKEFGSDIIVRINKNKVNFGSQEFKGKMLNLGTDAFSKTLIDNLNKPVNFDDETNSELKNQFNQATQTKITDASRGNFGTSSLLILDGEILDKGQLYTNVIIGFILGLLVLILFFRKKIFRIRRREEISEIVKDQEIRDSIN